MRKGRRWVPSTLLRVDAGYFAPPTQVARWNDSGSGRVRARSLPVQRPGFQLKVTSYDYGIIRNPWSFMKPRNGYDLTLKGDDGSWYDQARDGPEVGKAPQEGPTLDRCTEHTVIDGSVTFTQQSMEEDETVAGEGFFGYITSYDGTTLNFATSLSPRRDMPENFETNP